MLACGVRLRGSCFRKANKRPHRKPEFLTLRVGDRQGACVYIGYVVSPAVPLRRPFCTEPLMDNDWALSPQQMCWGREPGRAGVQPAEGRRGLRRLQGNHRRKPKKKKNEDIPTIPQNGANMMQPFSLKWAWQAQLLKDKKKEGRKINVFYICLACVSR